MDVNSCSDKEKSYIIIFCRQGVHLFMIYIKGRIIGRAGKERLSYMKSPFTYGISPTIWGEKTTNRRLCERLASAKRL